MTELKAFQASDLKARVASALKAFGGRVPGVFETTHGGPFSTIPPGFPAAIALFTDTIDVSVEFDKIEIRTNDDLTLLKAIDLNEISTVQFNRTLREAIYRKCYLGGEPVHNSNIRGQTASEITTPNPVPFSMVRADFPNGFQFGTHPGWRRDGAFPNTNIFTYTTSGDTAICHFDETNGSNFMTVRYRWDLEEISAVHGPLRGVVLWVASNGPGGFFQFGVHWPASENYDWSLLPVPGAPEFGDPNVKIRLFGRWIFTYLDQTL